MDGYTLFLVAAALECVGALMLLAVWFFTRDTALTTPLTMSSWVAFFALIGVGGLLICGRGVLPDLVSIVAGNAMVCLGIGMGRFALAELNGRPRQLFAIAVPPLLWIGLCSISTFYENFFARAVTLNTLVASQSVWMAWVALKYNRYRLQTGYFIGIICAMMSLVFLSNTILFATHTPDGLLAALTSDVIFINYFAFIILVSLLITLTFAMFIELQQKHFRRQARRDPLTGLHTRAAFFDTLDRHAQSATSSAPPASFVMIDLDNFKRVNDTHGHAFGDRVLELFGSILRDVLPPKAVAARMGGEEFALFLPEHYAGATHDLLETVRTRLCSESAHIPPAGHKVTMSAGVYLANGCDHEADHVLAIADRALYRAKANGRDRIEYANPPAQLKTPA